MIKNIIKRVSSTIVAAALAVTALAGNFADIISLKADAAEQVSVNPPDMKDFVTADELVKQAAQLLGARYEWGHKGYYNTYYANAGALSPANIKNANKADGGIDCSGLIYWTLGTLGYYTTGYSHTYNSLNADQGYVHKFGKAKDGKNYYSVAFDTGGWFVTDGTQKIGKMDTNNAYRGVQNGTGTAGYMGTNHNIAKPVTMSFQKSANTPATQANVVSDWWQLPNGDTIERGSICIAKGKSGNPEDDHTWIYIGEFANKKAVIAYLVDLGFKEADVKNYVFDDTAV